MRLVIVSDTHLYEIDPPEGDVLLHCGDMTYTGNVKELGEVQRQFRALAPRYKHGILYVAGNHDFMFDQDQKKALALMEPSGATYLQDSGIELEGVKFWGTPWVNQFYDWAFMAEEPVLARYYSKIPTDTDVLICHGPAFGMLDMTERGVHAGSTELRAVIHKVKPKVFAFGHIHEGYGQVDFAGVKYINASICDARYRDKNAPVVVDI